MNANTRSTNGVVGRSVTSNGKTLTKFKFPSNPCQRAKAIEKQHGKQLKRFLLDWAGDETTITVHRSLVDFVGSLEGGMMLSQLLYWTPKAKIDGGWIAKSDDDFGDELCLTSYKVRKARGEMEQLGILERKTKKFDGAPTTHYRLDFDTLVREFDRYLRDRESDFSKSDNPFPGLKETLTENTPETKTDPPSPSEEEEDFQNLGSEADRVDAHEYEDAFCWLRTVGDESKLEDVLRVLQRLFDICPPDRLSQLNPRDRFALIISVTHGEDLSALPKARHDHIVRILRNLYEENWTRPIAACTISSVRDIPLHRIDGVVRGWEQARKRTGPSQSYPRGDSVPEVEDVQVSVPEGSQDAEKDWKTNEEGYPFHLAATKRWALAHDIKERVAVGLWKEHGCRGWIDGDGQKINSLVRFANASEERLLRAASSGSQAHARSQRSASPSGIPSDQDVLQPRRERGRIRCELATDPIERDEKGIITALRDVALLDPGDKLLFGTALYLADQDDNRLKRRDFRQTEETDEKGHWIIEYSP